MTREDGCRSQATRQGSPWGCCRARNQDAPEAARRLGPPNDGRALSHTCASNMVPRSQPHEAQRRGLTSIPREDGARQLRVFAAESTLWNAKEYEKGREEIREVQRAVGRWGGATHDGGTRQGLACGGQGARVLCAEQSDGGNTVVGPSIFFPPRATRSSSRHNVPASATLHPIFF